LSHDTEEKRKKKSARRNGSGALEPIAVVGLSTSQVQCGSRMLYSARPNCAAVIGFPPRIGKGALQPSE
jgi:hypothetical protein